MNARTHGSGARPRATALVAAALLLCVALLATPARAQPALPPAAADALARGQRLAAEALVTYPAHAPDHPLWAQALAAGREAAAAAPDHPAPQRFLGQAYLQVGWYARAWTAWTRYEELGGTLDAAARHQYLEVARWMAIAAYDAGRHDEALPYLRTLVALDPGDLVGNDRLARYHLERGEPLEARPYLDALGGRSPDLVDAWDQARLIERHGAAAVAAYRTGRDLQDANPTVALARFVEATAAAPGFLEAWRARAEAARALGRDAEERTALVRVLALAPGDAAARSALAALDAAALEAERAAQAEAEAAAAAQAQAAAARAEAARVAAEQEAARVAAAQEAARAAAEAEAARLAAEREALTDAEREAAERAAAEAEAEAARAEAEAEAARLAAEEEARRAAEQEAARIAAEQEAARIAAEEEAARVAAEEARRAAEQEAARIAAEEEAARGAAQQEAARLAAEQEAARAAAAEQAARAAAQAAAATVLLVDATASHGAAGAASAAVAYVPASAPGSDLAALADGVLRVRVEVTAKPGDAPVLYQVCLVPPDVSVAPACSAIDLLAFRAPGTYVAEVRWSALSGAGGIDWSRGIDAVLWVLRRPDGTAVDAAAADAARYLPMTARVRASALPAGF